MPLQTPTKRAASESRTAAKMLAALLAFVVAVVLLGAAPASAQQTQKPKLTPLRSSETPQGSKLTITSTAPLNNYSAYRIGDRFYVHIPNADANAVRSGMSGRGFADAQVQKRGDDVVLSFRVQPGAKPRVNQRFNKLDVVFATSEETASGTPANVTPKPRETEAGSTTQPAVAQQGNTEKPPPPSVAEAAQQNPPANEQPTTPTEAASEAPPVEGSESQTAAAPDGQQLAEARQTEGAPAPVKITTDPAATQPSTSIGATILRNWPLALIATLLLVGLGLFLASRRSSNGKTAPEATEAIDEKRSVATVAPLTTAHKVEPAAAMLQTETVQPEVEVAPALVATAAKPASVITKGSKKKRKKEKKRGLPAAIAPVVEREKAEEKKEAEASEASPVEMEAPVEVAQAVDATQPDEVMQPVEVAPAVEEPAVQTLEEAPAEVFAFEQAEPAVETVEAPAVEEVVTPAVEESPTLTGETSPVLEESQPVTEEPLPLVEESSSSVKEIALAEEPSYAAPMTGEIEPAAPLIGDDAVQSETRRLLAGEAYNKNLAGVSDVLMRQMIASELLSALAGRNTERRERARTAFIEHGYFNETTRDLRDAETPAERASAARSLGLVGDRLATFHLVPALEDPSMEVRRAAVEALAHIRDPRAIEPLKALLEREKTARIKLPRRLVQHAIEACAEPHELPAPTLAESSAAAVVTGEETASALEVSTVEASTEWTETAVETEGVEAKAIEESATTVEEIQVEESAIVEPEEPPALVASDEIVATPFETMPVETAATETALPTSIEEWTEVEEAVEPSPFVSETAVTEIERAPAAAEEPRTVELEAPAAPFEASPVADVAEELDTVAEETSAAAPPLELEFESHRGEALMETAAGPIEDFSQTSDEMAAGDWIELDMEDARAIVPVAPVAEVAAPSETLEVEEDRADAFALEGEQAARPSASMDAYETARREITSPGDFQIRPAGLESAAETSPVEVRKNTEDRAIAPFVADDMTAVPKAIQLRLASEEPEERATAIKDLAHVTGDDAFQVICAGFDDASPEVRNAAARSLSNLQDDRAETFTRALREAEPARRRAIGAAIAASGLAAESISHLTGESREKTYDAFSLLFLMAKAGEVQPLLRAVEAHPDNEVRLAVVKLLALSGQKEVVQAFRRLAVRNTLPADVRTAVMEAIYQISSSQPVS